MAKITTVTAPDARTARTRWVDLQQAADHAGVGPAHLMQAISGHQIRVTTAHPQRPGEPMVPLGDVDLWARQQQLTKAVTGRLQP